MKYAPSICTVSGMEFNFLNPAVDMVRISDVAHSLSRIPRFGGHTLPHRNISVAQHACWVHDRCLVQDRRVAAYGLFHDCGEFVFGDCASPIKQYLPELTRMENVVADAVLAAIGLEPVNGQWPTWVKFWDDQAMHYERAHVMPGVSWWPLPEDYQQRYIAALPPTRVLSAEQAYREFMDRVQTLVDLAEIHYPPSELFESKLRLR